MGSAQIVNNSIRSKDVRNGTLQGRDLRRNTLDGARIRESSLAAVPSALRAATADSAARADSASQADAATRADSASRADSAASADSAAVANAAGVAYFSIDDDPFTLGGSGFTNVLTLEVPVAGSYLILGNATLNNNDAGAVSISCEVVAGSRVVRQSDGVTGQAAGTSDFGNVAITVAHTFEAPGSVVLRCENPGGDAMDTVVEHRTLAAARIAEADVSD